MKAATKSADISSPKISTEYEFELKRLLFLAPAITEALALDTEGVVQAQASRFRAVSPFAQEGSLSISCLPAIQARANSYFGTVYFRDSDPYITVAVPIERLPGEITVSFKRRPASEIFWTWYQALNLERRVTHMSLPARAISLPTQIRLVLQRRNVGQLNQVKAAFQSSPGAVQAKGDRDANIEGQKVFSSYALIPILDWAVFIERPVEEAYAPIYASLLRTSILLLIGLGVALLASFLSHDEWFARSKRSAKEWNASAKAT